MATDPATAPSNGLVRTPPSGMRTIFRSEALEQYRASQDRIAFPRFSTPRALTVLWVLSLIFIVIGGAIIARAWIPFG